MHRTQSLLVLVLAAGFAALAPARAAESLDVEAEAKQAAQEDKEQAAERETGVRGKYQKKFYGTFQRLPETPDKDAPALSPDVVGTYSTNASDMKPGRNYLVKIENGSKAILDALKRGEGRKAEIIGKLRNIGPEGDAKYVIVTSVLETGATPPPVGHKKLGGL